MYLFAGITGDLAPIHVDEEYMKRTRYGRRIARFPAPLYIGDTVTVTYEIVERDPTQRKTFARVTCTTQTGAVVAAATHILKAVEPSP